MAVVVQYGMVKLSSPGEMAGTCGCNRSRSRGCKNGGVVVVVAVVVSGGGVGWWCQVVVSDGGVGWWWWYVAVVVGGGAGSGGSGGRCCCGCIGHWQVQTNGPAVVPAVDVELS